MADPTLVLLILIGASPAERPRSAVMSSAVSDALGRSARVLVEERDVDPSDAEAATLAEGIKGSAVAEIVWVDAAREHVHLHVYLAADRTWYDRDVAFEQGDALDERERAVGFLVGAMIRESHAGVLADVAPPRVVVPEAAPPTAITASEIAAPPARPDARRESSRFGVDLGGLATTGIAGDAAGLGPSVRLRVFAYDELSFHAGGALGFGSIASADARMTTTRLVAGGRWCWLTIAREVSFELGVEALAVNHVVHRSEPKAARDRWLAGAHADLGVTWRATNAFEPFLRGGIDGVTGSTPVTVAGARLAQIPPFRGVAELGLAFRF